MVWLRLVYLFVAMMVCSVGAGIGIARRIFDEPKLVLAASAGIGGIVLYLIAGGIYLTGISWNFSYLVTAGCAIALLWERGEITRWWHNPETKQLLIGWLLIELWIVLVNLNIRHFALWIGDWEEHYNRAKFFLQHWPVWAKVFGDYYILPSRPPMMNIIESLFMAQSGSSFGDYQMVSGFLNGMLYLAVAGLAVQWSGKRRTAALVAALLALNPWFMQNATFTWTKLYSDFYVLLGIWFYLRRSRGVAMVMMTAGCLVHYAVVVVPVFIALYDVIFCFREWRRILTAWVASAALMATWVSWGLMKYGSSFFNNTTTVTEAHRRTRMDLIHILVWNGWHSLAPIGFEPWAIARIWHSNLHWEVKIRDWLFLAYEPGLILSWGIGGAVVIWWCLAHSHPLRSKFWTGLILFTFAGGILLCTPPGYDYGGVAHVVLQPITWIGMAWIASRALEMPGWLIKFWCGGVFLDAAWLMLHFMLEGRWLEFIRYPTRYVPVDAAAGSYATIGNALTQLLRDLWFLGMNTFQYDALFLTAMICAALVWWISLRTHLRRLP